MFLYELEIPDKNDPRSRQVRWCVFKRRPHLNGESLCIRHKNRQQTDQQGPGRSVLVRGSQSRPN
jgi:hypothetical protein